MDWLLLLSWRLSQSFQYEYWSQEEKNLRRGHVFKFCIFCCCFFICLFIFLGFFFFFGFFSSPISLKEQVMYLEIKNGNWHAARWMKEKRMAGNSNQQRKLGFAVTLTRILLEWRKERTEKERDNKWKEEKDWKCREKCLTNEGKDERKLKRKTRQKMLLW